MVRQAEQAKARIYEVPGKSDTSSLLGGKSVNEMIHSMIVDETYSIMVSHIDDTLRRKIVNDEFVDFVRLLPKSRPNLIEDEERGLQQVVAKGGMMYCLRPGERLDGNKSPISSFNKWGQAFRIFTRIYTEVKPKKAPELTQYSYIIRSASLSYPWENVYAYDKDFRYHLSENPE